MSIWKENIKLKSLSIAAGLLASCCLAISLDAHEVITCKSPDGKFALRHTYSDQQPYIGDTAIIEVATRKILMPLTSNRALSELQLVWSDDSQRVAYYDETTQTRPPRVFFRSGSSFNETALPELLPPKLPASAASGDPETKARIEPIRWLKPGDLLIESELLNPAWGRVASKITIAFDRENRPSVRNAEEQKASIVDYFLLLPADDFEGPPSVWLRHARSGGGNLYLCEAEPREKYVDEKNGYMICGGDGAQPGLHIALFRYRDGRPLLALCSDELEGDDSVSLRFFELSPDNKMREIERSVFPVADSKDNVWKFELPREGKAILVRARKNGKILHKVTWNGEKFQEEK